MKQLQRAVLRAEQQLVAPGGSGNGCHGCHYVADQRVEGAVGVGGIGLVLVHQEEVFIQVAPLLRFRHPLRQVGFGQEDAHGAGVAEVPVEPAFAGVGYFLRLHGGGHVLADGVGERRQEEQFPAVDKARRGERQGHHLRVGRRAVGIVRAALFQGKEPDAGLVLSLELAFRDQEEVEIGFVAEGGIVLRRAELEGRDAPVLYEVFPEGAVDNLIARHHHLGDFVGEVREAVLARGYPAL